MTRVSDEQIAEWRACRTNCDHRDLTAHAILDALEAERARGDAAEAETSRLVGKCNELVFQKISLKQSNPRKKRLIRTLWNSRRMWQRRALEAEVHSDCAEADREYVQLLGELELRDDQLAEAQAWAAWFAAKANYYEIQLFPPHGPMSNEYTLKLERDLGNAEARVAVLEGVVAQARGLHEGRTMTSPNDHVEDFTVCVRCSLDRAALVFWPCELIRILDQTKQ